MKLHSKEIDLVVEPTRLTENDRKEIRELLEQRKLKHKESKRKHRKAA